MWALKTRMYLLLMILFSIVYALVTVIGTAMGIRNFYFYLIFSLVLMYVQYMIGPKIVEWSMRVRYVSPSEEPELHSIVKESAAKAGIPVPRVGISASRIPNAFAFGRGPSDGRICVTAPIMNLLDREELKAVIGHEMSHLKNRDVLTITILSVIPMVMYRIAWHFLWFGGSRRRDQQNTVFIGILAFLFYFVTNLLVLYASRVREYFADRGSVSLGNRPEALASALYKLVYGSARMNKEELKDTEGLKAFFVNDPSTAKKEISELARIDLDGSGTIDSRELAAIGAGQIRLGLGDRLLELLSTHPNMLKRIKHLSSCK